MGRGAGNLNTELITHFINCNIEERYDLVPILELIDDAILPIYKYTPWGFSEPYYLSAIMGVHPNHASYLIDKQSVGMAKIFDLLNRLPASNRHIFVKKDIENLYRAEMAHNVEDSAAIKELSDRVRGRDVLVIAPGASIRTQSDKIKRYIGSKRPFVITLNFIPDSIAPDLVFVSNRKRFEQLGRHDLPIAVTSNVRMDGKTGAYVINYDSLLQEDYDSSGIIVLRFLIRLGVKRALLAGYDGFTVGVNHYNDKLDSYLLPETVASLNNSMGRYLREITGILPLEFITPSVYEVTNGD
jgi:4-hydroxy 2-oxovalerate aldolase